MSKSNNFHEYPAILRIEADGRIIAYDKKGRVNAELNEKTLTKEDEYRVFGKALYDDYKRQQYSRYERNRDTYNDDNLQRQSRPEDYYTQRDREHDLAQQESLKKSKKRNKWLIFGIVVLLIIVLCVIVKSCSNDSTDNAEDNQTQQSNETNSNSQEADKQQVEDQNNAIKDEIQETQDSIKNGESDTNSKLQDLQNQVDQLEQQSASDNGDSVVKDYQNTIDKLKNAQTERENGNNSAMQEQLDSVKEDVSSIKDKLDSWLDKLNSSN